MHTEVRISKIKRILSSQSDAIGYLYRKGNTNILSFATTDAVACGARPSHLRNAEIVISEMKENGVLETHWERIYIEEKEYEMQEQYYEWLEQRNRLPAIIEIVVPNTLEHDYSGGDIKNKGANCKLQKEA